LEKQFKQTNKQRAEGVAQVLQCQPLIQTPVPQKKKKKKKKNS
jgi:hypothetical protein